jgi:NAD(P)H-nitrite reductase large subunit
LHIVIIGNGGAGISALQTIREVDKESKITIISREKFPAYSPCSLPHLLSGEADKQKILRFDKRFYNKLDATFMKNAEALRVSPRKKVIELADENIIKYDKLLIAAGASPIVPEGIDGAELKGVHVMGTLDSTLKILSQAKEGAKKVVVVGGGFMGIETAVMLRKRGLKVVIVELLPEILARMLDPDMSGEVMKILTGRGIKVVLNDAVKSISGNKIIESVSLGKDVIKCDMVVMAIGVTPNTHLVQGSGIKANRGILVDSQMRTNVKDIFAAGDIAEVREQIRGKMGSFAIWPNAVEQGRIAGSNMTGMNLEYAGAEVVNVLDVFGTPIVAMGDTSKEIGKCKVVSRSTPHSHKKLLVKNGRILGLQFVNSIRNAGPLYALMKRGEDVNEFKNRLLDDNFVLALDIDKDLAF